MSADLLAHLPLLLIAAFLAGMLNAAAGGGSFVTLPALIFVGLPPVAANATGTVAPKRRNPWLGICATRWSGWRSTHA